MLKKAGGKKPKHVAFAVNSDRNEHCKTGCGIQGNRHFKFPHSEEADQPVSDRLGSVEVAERDYIIAEFPERDRLQEFSPVF